MDDIAWENDRIAFRTYSPALQATGEQAFGYDIWTKCVSEPVVDMRYKTELNPESRAKIAELRKTDKKSTGNWPIRFPTISTNGNGLDYYKSTRHWVPVLPPFFLTIPSFIRIATKNYEILDNGPLRFTVKLVYNPLKVKRMTISSKHVYFHWMPVRS